MIDSIAAKENVEMTNQEVTENLSLEKIRGVVVEPFQEKEKETTVEEVKKAKKILLTKYIPALKPDIQVIKKVPS